MKDPFREIRENRRSLAIKWVSRTFAGPNTFRVLPKGKAEKARRSLIENVGDGRNLRTARDEGEYDRTHRQIVARMGKTCRLPFGHAVKLVNLYVKELVTRRGVISESLSRRIYRFAHVTVDRVILDRLRHDYPEESKPLALRKTLKSMNQSEYDEIQAFLRDRAKPSGSPALDYDLRWAERP
jgi:hypothetical protein